MSVLDRGMVMKRHPEGTSDVACEGEPKRMAYYINWRCPHGHQNEVEVTPEESGSFTLSCQSCDFIQMFEWQDRQPVAIRWVFGDEDSQKDKSED